MEKEHRTVLLRLPQSLVRLLGHNQLASLSFHQFPIISPLRKEWENAPEKELFRINRLILESLSLSIIGSKKGNYEYLPGEIETILDYSVLHNGYLLTNLFLSKQPVSISPYAAMDFSPITSDLKLNPTELLKCFKRSLTLMKYANIKEFYDWGGYSKPRNVTYLPWLWRSEMLNLDLALERIQKVVSALRLESEFVSNFIDSPKALLILVTDYDQAMLIEDYVENLIIENKKLFNWVEENSPEIFITQHSLLGMLSQSRKKLLGGNLHFVRNLAESLIPAEIFILGRPDARVASQVGSSIFSTPSERLFRLRQESESILLSGHNLMSARRMKFDGRFPWA